MKYTMRLQFVDNRLLMVVEAQQYPGIKRTTRIKTTVLDVWQNAKLHQPKKKVGVRSDAKSGPSCGQTIDMP